MTVHKLRASRLLSPEALAGWIFADILIVLFIVSLGAAAAPPAPLATPTPTPTPTATPSKPVERPKAKPALRPKAVSVTVKVNPDRLLDSGSPRAGQLKSVCRQLKRSIKAKDRTGDRAALVLIFGGGGDVTDAQRRANLIGRGLKSCAGQRTFDKKVVSRDFWDGSLPVNRARLEIFVYTKSG